MSCLKVWIHSRVSNIRERELLIYQKELLRKIAEDAGMQIVGVSDETSKGVDIDSKALISIKVHARRHDFDVLLVYDKTRILIHDDLFAEFKMICEMNDVCILTYQELEKLFLK